MSNEISYALARLTTVERRWNGPMPQSVRYWAAPAAPASDRPFGPSAARLRHAMAARRRLHPSAIARQDTALVLASEQLLQWRSQAVSKLAAARRGP